MKYFSFLIVFFITSCSVASEIVTDKLSVISINLQLIEDGEKCYLIDSENRTELFPKPPCHFLRNSDGSPQYYAYSKSGIDATLIVSGTPISNSIRKQWGILSGLVCGFSSQGVLIKSRKVSITTKTLEGGVLCRDQGSDEKNYWYFSH